MKLLLMVTMGLMYASLSCAVVVVDWTRDEEPMNMVSNNVDIFWRDENFYQTPDAQVIPWYEKWCADRTVLEKASKRILKAKKARVQGAPPFFKEQAAWNCDTMAKQFLWMQGMFKTMHRFLTYTDPKDMELKVGVDSLWGLNLLWKNFIARGGKYQDLRFRGKINLIIDDPKLPGYSPLVDEVIRQLGTLKPRATLIIHRKKAA